MIAAALLMISTGAVQIWEKPVAPGLLFREEVDRLLPRVVYEVRWTPASPACRAVEAQTGGSVFAPGSATGRFPVSHIVRLDQSLGGINGDFFVNRTGPTGNPLGISVQDGELCQAPSMRAWAAWGPNSFHIGSHPLPFKGTIQSRDGSKIELNGLNRACGANEVILETSVGGAVPLAHGQFEVILRTDSASWAPNSVNSSTVLSIAKSRFGFVRLRAGDAALIGAGRGADELSALKVDDKVTIGLSIEGFDSQKWDEAIGGGPMLLRRGERDDDSAAEGFSSEFYENRHARTALGMTRRGDVWFVVVDGGSSFSVGATIGEMADLMKRLGCVDAINLDGGGSSTINLLGTTVNRPSDGKERPVADSILWQGSAPLIAPEANYSIRLAQRTRRNEYKALLIDGSGHLVPNLSVIWSATGSGWIDQGGAIHRIGNGSCIVHANVRGVETQLTLHLGASNRAQKKSKGAPTD